MAQLSVDRKQRLRTLENDIRKNAESIQKNGLQIGRDLIEIRDNELWKGDYESWNQYLKAMAEDLVGKSWARSLDLIEAAEVRKRIPETFSSDVTTELQASHLNELSRLAPTKQKDSGAGREKDWSKLRKQDVERVLKRATEIAKQSAPEGKQKEITPSVRDVRKAVDVELGIDRTTKRDEPKQDPGIDLHVYLNQKIGQIEGIIELLADVPADGWKQLEKSNPQLAERLATVCDQLAELLRS
jgi:hypothetical protein